MVGVKEAIQTAYNYMQEVYPENLRDLRLEEVDQDEATGDWLITMGFVENVPQPVARTPTQAFLGVGQAREFTRAYKLLTIDKETGDVKRMKIRNI